MPRWNPIPSALSQEPATDVADTPTENHKFNGYIFKRCGGEVPGFDADRSETLFIPKVCRALPLYPKTYGLSCDRQDCQHCHPETAAHFPNAYDRPSNWYMRNREDRHHGYYTHYPKPGTCLVGRRGCKPHRMVRIRPAKSEGVVVVAKDETRRRAARAEQAAEEEQDENKRDKTQRLSKWEASTVRRIDEGCELAMSGEVVLPTDDWKAEDGDIQLAILASLGLLDDYEAEDADISLNTLPRNEDIYTIKYKPSKKKPNTHRDPEQYGVPMLDEDVDWELVLASSSEGSLSWIVLDE